MMDETHPSLEQAAKEAAGAVEPPPQAVPIADDSERLLHPNYIRVRQLGGWIAAGVLGLAFGVFVAILVLVGDLPPVGIALVIVAWLAVTGLVCWRAQFWPAIDFRHRRWRLSPVGMEIRRGVWWREVINVPRARIQHTDVNQGPIERRFGIAHLVIHTAGTMSASVHLFGLGYDEAIRVRDELLRTGTGDAV